MPDEPKWYQPGYRPPPVPRQPAEALWTVRKGDQQVTCELRDHGIVTGYFVDDKMAADLQELGAGIQLKPLWLDDLVALVRRLLSQRAEAPVRSLR